MTNFIAFIACVNSDKNHSPFDDYELMDYLKWLSRNPEMLAKLNQKDLFVIAYIVVGKQYRVTKRYEDDYGVNKEEFEADIESLRKEVMDKISRISNKAAEFRKSLKGVINLVADSYNKDEDKKCITKMELRKVGLLPSEEEMKTWKDEISELENLAQHWNKK